MISFVIPVLNESQSLGELCEQIDASVRAIERSYEVIFVDDGSSDATWAEVSTLSDRYPTVRGIRLARNFGKAAALAAGFADVQGDLVVTMDGDLQDDPENLGVMLAEIDAGADLVVGWRKLRNDRLRKRFASWVFNRLVSFATGVRLRDQNCGLKLFRAALLPHIKLYGELHRYIPALVGSLGFDVREVAVVHNARKYGRSRYGIWRYFSSLLDLVTVLFLNRFRHRPLHFLGSIGAVAMLVGGAGLTYLATIWLLGAQGIGDRPLLYYSSATLLFGGQLFMSGILAELITASYADRSMPFVVSDTTDGRREISA